MPNQYTSVDSRYITQQNAIDDIAQKYNLVVFRPPSHSAETHNFVFIYQDARDVEKGYPLWWFSNTDQIGQYDLSCGKLKRGRWVNLAEPDWKERLEGSVLLSVYEQMEISHVNSCGGYFNLPEADDVLNELNRQMIDALYKLYGKAYMFKLTSSSQCDPFVEYSGQKIYNFDYDCVVPDLTDEIRTLYARVQSKIEPSSGVLLNAIAKCGGLVLIWR